MYTFASGRKNTTADPKAVKLHVKNVPSNACIKGETLAIMLGSIQF